jgi:hypothetical protein
MAQQAIALPDSNMGPDHAERPDFNIVGEVGPGVYGG